MVRHGLRTVLSLRLLRGGKVRLHGLLADEQHRVQQLRGAELLARGPSGLHELPDDAGRLRLAQRHGPDELRVQRDGGLRVERDERDLLAFPLHGGRQLQRLGPRALHVLRSVRRGQGAEFELHGDQQYSMQRVPGEHLFERRRCCLHGVHGIDRGCKLPCRHAHGTV